ncbi:MAG TPA: winged helix-turn-helix domain-containing protein [Candidatus Dormibacteraeota bacterium]|nr:winged helix-turn-helix domain-containing protein [Candidatus Dormibacteraeota bacterium]
MDVEKLSGAALLRARIAEARAHLDEQNEHLSRLLAACNATRAARAQAMAPARRIFAIDVVRLGEVEVLVTRQAVRDGNAVRRLTPTEWQLLLFLLDQPGVVHTRSELAGGAWGSGYHGRDTEVEVYVSRLRRKLGRSGRLLETVRGRGYRLALGAPQADLPAAISA